MQVSQSANGLEYTNVIELPSIFGVSLIRAAQGLAASKKTPASSAAWFVMSPVSGSYLASTLLNFAALGRPLEQQVSGAGRHPVGPHAPCRRRCT